MSKRHLIVCCILVACAAITLYLPTLRHDFVYYDDNQYITDNVIVQKGLTAENVRWAFTTLTASNWHPLTWLSHMTDVQVWGLWPGGHHFTNLVLHAANSLLLLLVLWRMTNAVWRSAFVAMVFAVHPLHVESVAWVAERKDMLSAFFGLLAIGAYVNYVRESRNAWYWAMIVMFAMSLMCKPMLVTLPAILILLDVWPLQRWRRNAVIKQKQSESESRRTLPMLLLEKAPLWALAAASSVITIIAQKFGGAISTLEAVPLSHRLVNTFVSYVVYLQKTIWPTRLAVFYPPYVHATWQVAVSIILLLGISVFAIVRFRRQPFLLIGWLWFLGTLVPVIGLVQVGAQSMADRYMYVPMIGLLIMAAWSVPDWKSLAQGAKSALGAIAVLVVLALVVTAWVQIGHWKNTATLFAHAVSVTERNVVAHNILGVAMRQQGEYESAKQHLRAALGFNPNYAAAHNNLGLLAMDQRQYADAVAHFQESIRHKNDDPYSWNNLGAALNEIGRRQEAIASYKRAVQLLPNFAKGYINLGNALLADGRHSEAIAALQQAVASQPDLSEAHMNLGAAYWAARQVNNAIVHYQTALNLDPQLIECRANLGVAFASEGRFDEAIVQFERVLQAQPNREDIARFLQMARQQREQAGSNP